MVSIGCCAGIATAADNPPPASAAFASSDDLIKVEVQFTSGLIQLGFPDYARKVMDRFVATHPEAKPAAAAVRIDASTAQGRFEEAEALLASVPPNSIEAMTMRLALGDRYYQWGKLAKAREQYEIFFNCYSNGPPKEIRAFYEASAYKYSQMLLLKGDVKGSLKAMRYVLLANPDVDVRRQVQCEMAELLLKVGTAASGPEREACFKEAAALCNEVQFRGDPDILFGRTVVILAHIATARGKNADARRTITGYMTMLKQIDDAMRAQNLPMRDSPMAQCRYLLGTLGEEDGRALYADKTKEKEAAGLLEGALSQLYTVVIKYPSSSWALDAGRRIEGIVSFLESKGRKVQTPKVDRSALVAAQFKEARVLFQESNYGEAARKYLEALNLLPDAKESVAALGELAQCYIQEQNDVYCRATIRHLVERFSRDESLTKDAGDALLGVARVYEESGQGSKAYDAYTLFFDKFPAHEKAPSVLLRLGDAKMRTGSYQEAAAYFAKIADNYAKARVYPDALNRLAYCYTMAGDHTNAIKVLTLYVAELSPGPEKINAVTRLADSYRLTEQWVQAINEYTHILGFLTQEAATYSPTPDDAAKNLEFKERATFWKAYCYSRLRTPQDKIPEYQTKAIEGYQAFVKEFPKSKLAPNALSGMGTIYYLQHKPDEAGRAFDRLGKEFPDAPQSKNVLFAQGQALLDLGQADQAVEVFEKMFSNTNAYTPLQFLQVGQAMLAAKQHTTAQKAYALARTSAERGIWEPASMGLAQSLLGMGKPAEGVVPIEAVLTKYKNSVYTIEGSLILSRAYADMAQQEQDAGKRTALFNKAIAAMNTVRQYAKDSGVLANADLESAAIQLRMGDKNKALGSYTRLLLLGDGRDPKVRPCIEKAFESGVPLMLELGNDSDVLEACESYLNAFPDGRLAGQAKKWRDQMTMKGVRSSGGTVLPRLAPPVALATTNAPASAATK